MNAGRVTAWMMIPGLCVATLLTAQPAGRGSVSMVLNEEMYSIPGKEVAIQKAVYPAGWVGTRHYHTGDVFVYVLEGRFNVDVDGGEKISIGPGEVYHEAMNKHMVARNASADEPVTVLLFQVGDRGEPRVIISK